MNLSKFLVSFLLKHTPMIRYFNLYLLLCLCLQATAQQDTPQRFTWQIAAETTPCPAAPATPCLLYKSKDMKEFKILEEGIEGFTYVAGNTYTILVEQLPHPVTDSLYAVPYSYKLVKVIKEKNTTPKENSPKKGNTEWEVYHETVRCETTATKKCLLVKTKGQREFEVLDGVITGFQYEEGYSYQITVKTDSSGHYTLVKEKSKKIVQAPPPAPVDTVPAAPLPDTLAGNPDGKWYLRKLIDPVGVTYASDHNIIWVEVSLENGRISGFGACNAFTATVSQGTQRQLTVSDIASDSTYCGNQKIEDMFYKFLLLSEQYEMREGQLDLIYKGKKILSFVALPANKN